MGEGACIGPGGHRAKAEGGRDQGAGLGTVDLNQLFQRDAFLFGIKVENLTGDEAEAAGGGSGGVEG